MLQSQILSLEEQNSLLERKILEVSQKCPTSHSGRPQQTSNRASLASTDPPLQEAQEQTTSTSSPMHSPTAQYSRGTPHRSTQSQNSHLFCIIWGTRKSCSEADICATLAQFRSLNSQAYTVKKSFRRLGARKAWWFTVIASSPTALTSLDEAWEASKPDANWTLLKSLRDRPFLRHGQSLPRQTSMPSESNALPPGSLPSFQPYPPPQPTNPDSSSLSARPPHPFPIPSGKPVPSPLQHPLQSLPPFSLHQSAAVAPNRHSLSLPYPPSPPSSGNYPAPQAAPQNILTQAHDQAHSNLGTNNAPHPFLGSGLPPPYPSGPPHALINPWNSLRPHPLHPPTYPVPGPSLHPQHPVPIKC